MFKLIIKHTMLCALALMSVIMATHGYASSSLSVATFTLAPMMSPNGSISPNMPQTINANTNITFTATPDPNFIVDQWKVDGQLVQTGGASFTLVNVNADHSVQVTFTSHTVVYAAGANSYLY